MSDSLVNKHVEMMLADYAMSQHITMQQALQSVPQATLHHLSTLVENSLITVGASGAIYGILLAFGMCPLRQNGWLSATGLLKFH